MDQLRADLLTDLFLSSRPTGHELYSAGSGSALENVNATVQVTIPVDQMIDRDKGTSWIDEGGLVSPDTARSVAGKAAGWERLFYRPESGEIERVDHYRPSAAQRRALIGRDVTCRFPGCTTPARKADIDHTRAYAEGGKTALSNLAALCESHHMMKHGSGWTPRQLPGGVIEWTSPTGRTYRDEPASRVFFRPSIEMSPPEARPGAPPDIPADDPSLRAAPREGSAADHEGSATPGEVSAAPWEGSAAPGGHAADRASVAGSRGTRDDGGFARIVDELELELRARTERVLEHEIARDREQRNAELTRQRYAERQEDRADGQPASGESKRRE